HLGEDALAEEIARLRERKRGMRMETFERRVAARSAADAEVEGSTAVGARPGGGEVAPDAALMVVGARAAGGELGIGGRIGRPAFDAAGCLEPGDGGD